jgi:hypothetical protein
VVGLAAALVLLLVGELAPGALPEQVRIAVTGNDVLVQMDGVDNKFHLPSGRAYTSIRFVGPQPVNREFQVDGSDSFVRRDRDAAAIQGTQDTLLYRFDAWLRDEGSYSRWDNARLLDGDSGAVLAQGREAVEQATLPPNFVLEAELRRPEAPAQIWLATEGPNSVLEVNRAARTGRWLVGDGKDEVAHWFFPEHSLPFAAGLLELVGRAAVAGCAMFGAVLGLSWIVRRLGIRVGTPRIGRRTTAMLIAVACAGWLGAASWISIELYHQLPHLLDASTFAFQARLMQAGRLWLEAPPLGKLFTTDLQAIRDGRWIGQYPPGAPALYGLGGVVGLSWLVGPICALIGIACTAVAARDLYDHQVGIATLLLGLISPFILFLSGAFMSEPIAGAALAGALAAFAYARRRQRSLWYAAAGALLGLGFVTREFGTILFAAPLGAWLLLERRWRGLALLVAAGVPFVAVYLAYNAAVTGNPLLLPRNAVDPTDLFGFGTYGDRHHTLAAGLMYTDMNLTLLQFDLFGWPPLFALGLPMLPFLLGAARRIDVWLAIGVVCCIAGYVLVPGHGAQLGPRYFYGALPYLLPLAARGLVCMGRTARRLGFSAGVAGLSVAIVTGLLTVNTLAYYLPHAVDRRANYLSMVSRPGLALPFVQTTLQGPQLVGFDGPTLVLVPNSELYKTLSALNCPLLDPENIQKCPVLFVGAGKDRAAELSQAYPGRTVLVATPGDRSVSVVPL